MANGTAVVTGVTGTAKAGQVTIAGDYTILKLTPLHCVVAVRGGGKDVTIPLALLATIHETPSTPIVDIKGITAWCLDASGNQILRNAVVLWDLPAYPLKYQFDGLSDTQNHTYDIEVKTGATDAVIMLELVKKGGYSDSQFVPLQ